MKYVLLTVAYLAWCAAIAFAAWVAWRAGHHVWAAVIPLVGLCAVEVRVPIVTETP